MKSAVFSMLIATAAMAAAPALASAGLDLAQKSNCLACHTVDKKLVGPSYRDIAKKYAGTKGAEEKLFEKLKKGGAGVWGPIPMPPNVQLKDEDIKSLVKWILAGAK